MEHRCADRFEMAFDAWIQRRDGLVLLGKTRNISFDGMFIELCECPLIRNTIVKVTYDPGGQPSMPQRAIVVHTGPEGAGLMFELPDYVLHQELPGIAYPAPVFHGRQVPAQYLPAA